MFKEFYGEFYRILDACADSAYQALFSAYEKEPGVEANPLHACARAASSYAVQVQGRLLCKLH